MWLAPNLMRFASASELSDVDGKAELCISFSTSFLSFDFVQKEKLLTETAGEAVRL